MIHHHGGGALLLVGDALEVLAAAPERSVNCIVTSPPYYGLRDYGTAAWVDEDPNCDHQMGDKLDYVCVRCGGVKKDRQYGLEATPAAYVETMRALFAEARRVLADDGTLWLNIGDSYVCSPKGSESKANSLNGRSNHLTTPAGFGGKNGGGLAPKQLLGIPWRTAFALQDDGWILRNAIVWHKPNAMPESVRDRMSKRYEEIFLFSKSTKYFFDMDAVREPHAAPNRKAGTNAFRARDLNHERTATGDYDGPSARGKNPGDVWSISTRPFPQAHFATFPIDLPLRCIKAGCKPGGIVLDPFSGAGTTGLAALQLGRQYIGIDLNPEYHDMAIERFATLAGAACP